MNRFRPLIVLALLACLYPYRVEQTETRSRSAGLVNSLHLITHNGQVTASASEDTGVTVNITRYAYGRNKADATKRVQEITLLDTLEANDWSLEAILPGINSPCGASFDARGPARTQLNIQTSNGKVTLSGFSNGVSVLTSNAQVILTATGGDAQIITTNGKVTVQVHSGGMSIQTSNGDIDCDLALLPATKSAVLNTTSGKVTLRLPPDVSATIEATTTNGTVVITGYRVEYEEQSQNHIRARIGSGAAPVSITTSNGDIVIQSRSL